MSRVQLEVRRNEDGGGPCKCRVLRPGKDTENKKLRSPNFFWSEILSSDEKRLSQRKNQELRVQLQAITVEITN